MPRLGEREEEPVGMVKPTGLEVDRVGRVRFKSKQPEENLVTEKGVVTF